MSLAEIIKTSELQSQTPKEAPSEDPKQLQKEKRRVYVREWRERKRQQHETELVALRQAACKGSVVSLFLAGVDKLAAYDLKCENDYVRLIEDLLLTLKNNGLIVDAKVVRKGGDTQSVSTEFVGEY